MYQKCGYNKGMRYLLLSVLVVCIVGILMAPAVSSQQVTIPSWIKNNAGWWASDQIPDSAFLQGIQFLIKEGIMVIPSTETSGSSVTEEVPTWIKNTAGWWADDKISEVEFVNAIQYLIKNGIIIVNNDSSCANDLSKIFGDSIAMVQNICNLHESTEYSELIPANDNINYNSLGFRGSEFSVVKPVDTYRIFLLGGSTMIGSGASSDETTKPGILQKIFDSDNSVKRIEVINAAFFGANSKTEFNFISQKLVNYQPDLLIIYDGLNDLKADYPIEHVKHNWKSSCELGKENNFDVIISLQPIPGFGNKKLTHQELVNSFVGQDHYGYQLITAKSTYDYMARELLSLQNDCKYVVDLRGHYDDISGPIYWDQGHVSDTANLVTAEKFYEIVNEVIFNKKSNENKFHSVISKYNSPIIASYLLSKIDIDVDYAQIEKQDLTTKNKLDGNFIYLKNKLGGSENILVGKDLSKADLSKINLTGQDLSGANLSGQAGAIKDLRNVDFTDTILRGANLSFTNLSGQDLSGKDLQGINFHGAILENVNLSNIITGREVQYISNPQCEALRFHPSIPPAISSLYSNHKCAEEVIQNEKIRTDFSDTDLRGITMNFPEYHYLHHIDFSGADLTGVNLSNIGFRNCDFTGTILNDSKMSEATFFYVDFSNAEMRNSQFTGLPFFQNVSFHNAKIVDGYFENPAFIDVDFSNADLKNTTLDGVQIAANIIDKCKNHEICN